MPSAKTAAKPLRLDALTLPEPGTDTTRRVLVRHMRRLERIFPGLPVRLMEPATRPLYVQAVSHWRQCRASGKGAHILRSAHISVLVECALRHANAGGDHAAMSSWVRELSVLVLTELALIGALPAGGISCAIGDGPLALRSPLANVHWQLPTQTKGLKWSAGQVIAVSAANQAIGTLTLRPDGDLPQGATRPYHPVTKGVWLAEVDNNPLSDFEAHPDKTGNQLDLGGKPASQWSDCLGRCFDLLDEYLPSLGAELRTVAQLIVPVGYDPERHLSASYQEYIGAAYMTLHDNDMTMVEALIHEFQHNKINAAFQQDPLLKNAFHPLYTSPVRPDPRPLHGVILAVHAFQPVAALYEAMDAAAHPWAKNPSWRRRYKQVIDKIRDGAATTLGNAEPTSIGKSYFADMARWDAHFEKIQKTLVAP